MHNTWEVAICYKLALGIHRHRYIVNNELRKENVLHVAKGGKSVIIDTQLNT